MLGKIRDDGYGASGLESRTQEVLPSDTPAASHDGPEDHTPAQCPAALRAIPGQASQGAGRVSSPIYVSGEPLNSQVSVLVKGVVGFHLQLPQPSRRHGPVFQGRVILVTPW